MVSSSREGAGNARRGQLRAKGLPLLRGLSLLLAASPAVAHANGAALDPMRPSGELVVVSKPAELALDVDEEVELNGLRRSVSVTYYIRNRQQRPLVLSMLFPIQGLRHPAGPMDCDDDLVVAKSQPRLLPEQYVTEQLHFVATLNGKSLPLKVPRWSEVALAGDYAKLAETSCWPVVFEVVLAPGANTLAIDHAMRMHAEGADGIGETYGYRYSIWPARNWVSRFGKARYRVVPPIQSVATWLDRFGKAGAQRSLKVTGPGEPIFMPSYVEFRVKAFVPKGELEFRAREELNATYALDCALVAPRTWKRALAQWLASRPYKAHERLLRSADVTWPTLDWYPKESGCPHYEAGILLVPQMLPYLRNEIYARRGQAFEQPELRELFDSMPWYVSLKPACPLSPLEEKNVARLAGLEQRLKTRLASTKDANRATVIQSTLDEHLGEGAPAPPEADACHPYGP
jgi:hypothetical protein